MAGSTELAERIDPEVLRASLDRSFAEMHRILERHGGVVEMVQVEALQMEWQELLKRPDQDPSALARIHEIDRELAEIRRLRAARAPK